MTSDERIPNWSPPRRANGHYAQSGVVACRRGAGGAVEVLLVSSRSGRRWVIPKGLIDPGESAVESARREAREEAGVVGALDAAPIGAYSYDKWQGTCDVETFLLRVERVEDDFLEAGLRERRWCAPREAAGLVDEDDLAALIRRAAERYESGDAS